MKIVGFFLVITSFVELSRGFVFSELLWFIFGILLLSGEACFEFFSHTERFIHRDKR